MSAAGSPLLGWLATALIPPGHRGHGAQSKGSAVTQLFSVGCEKGAAPDPMQWWGQGWQVLLLSFIHSLRDG
jgi:hypothetical protein